METKRKYDVTVAFVMACVTFVGGLVAFVLGITFVMSASGLVGEMSSAFDVGYTLGKLAAAFWQSMMSLLSSVVLMLTANFFMMVHIAKR